MAELTSLNLNLPSRVMVPVHANDHHVVRIPPAQAVVLNSKEKVGRLLLDLFRSYSFIFITLTAVSRCRIVYVCLFNTMDLPAVLHSLYSHETGNSY